ncbi:MAG: ROK family glucokinase [bacterium]
MSYLFGVDIGGTTVKIGFLSTDGNIIDRFEIKTNKENNGSLILSDVAKAIVSYLDNNNIDYNEVEGIGFGVPGPVTDNNIVTICVNISWKNKDVIKEFSKLIPFKTKMACTNDANAAAIGEMYRGSDFNYRNVIMLTLGTGVGGGVIVDNKAIGGTHGAGGELGHVVIDFKHQFQCNCGLRGCLETVASATGVVNIAKKYLKDNKSVLSNIKDLQCKDVFDNVGDNVADMVIDEVCEYLGRICSILAATTNPEVFIIGGGVSKAGDVLIKGIEKHFKKYSFGPTADTKIVLATLGNDAGMIGAALNVKSK